MQAEPNLEGAVAVDHRGQRFALGRTSDAYAVWPLSGGAPVRTFPQEERYWGTAWESFQDLEAGEAPPTGGPSSSGPAEPAEAAPPVAGTTAGTPGAAGPSAPEGVVMMDYQGSRFGVGRTRDAYAIWDLSRGGAPLETHPLTEDGWQVAWQRYHAHEAGGAVPTEASATAPPGEEAPAPTPEPAPAGEPELEGAAAVDYRGAAYALGRTGQGYAIWDTKTGGPPILTFPSTPDAWNQAWGAYQRLEGGPA
jgi:hypothetical protein